MRSQHSISIERLRQDGLYHAISPWLFYELLSLGAHLVEIFLPQANFKFLLSDHLCSLGGSAPLKHSQHPRKLPPAIQFPYWQPPLQTRYFATTYAEDVQNARRPVYLSLVTLWTCCAAPLATAMPASDEHQQLTLILRQPDVTDRHSSPAASYLVDPIPLPTSYPQLESLTRSESYCSIRLSSDGRVGTSDLRYLTNFPRQARVNIF